MSYRCLYKWQKLSNVPVQHMSCENTSTTTTADAKLPVCFVIIPGNPGCIQFYEKFSTSLAEMTGIPVRGVSHTGHAKIPKNNPQDLQHPYLEDCGLEMQIKHKLEYLRQIVFNQSHRIILIGHSIGCYIILQILERLDEKELERVSKSVLLFPTIERMSTTPNGKRLTPLLSKARWALSFFAYTVSYLPENFLDHLLPFFVKTSDGSVKDAVKDNLCDVDVANSCTFMGLEEMHKVKHRDDDAIEKNLDKLIFYYGAKDDWCPQEYYYSVMEKFGSMNNSQIYLCERGMDHAFVLSQSEQAAQVVAGWSGGNKFS